MTVMALITKALIQNIVKQITFSKVRSSKTLNWNLRRCYDSVL